MPSQAAGAAGAGDMTGTWSGGTVQVPAGALGVSGFSYLYYKRTAPLVITLNNITANGDYPNTTALLETLGAGGASAVGNLDGANVLASQPATMLDVTGRLHYTMQVSGTFGAASVQLEGSLDGVTFQTIGTALTAAGSVTVANAPYLFLRVKVTGATAPTLTVVVLALR